MQMKRLLIAALTGALIHSALPPTSVFASENAETAASDPLGRRGVMGIAPSITEDGRLQLRTVTPGGPADQAGLKPGDILVAIDGTTITDIAAGRRAFRKVRSGRTVKVTAERDGASITLQVTPGALPYETLSGAEVLYGTAETDAGMTRTIMSVPEKSALTQNGKTPLVFLIQGLTCTTIETLNNPASYMARLTQFAHDAGFATLRAEKLGVGDAILKDGRICEDAGFFEETKGFEEALRAALEDPRLDPARVYIVGISMGGLQGPLIADEIPVAGIISWGSGTGPWSDYFTWINRDQPLHLSQSLAEDLPRMRAERTIFHAIIERGMTPEDAAKAYPEAAEILTQNNVSMSMMAGRSYVFHQDLDRADSWGAWMRYPGKVIVAHGEFDRVSLPDDHKRILLLVNRHGKGEAEFRFFPGLGHGMTGHDSVESAFTGILRGEERDDFYLAMQEILTGWAKGE